ncbi:MAG: peptide chain release factor N(5)-glutamine methyltransferase [Oscillospiraceae bacterium]|nr:peptide chain release factor N(5)-glutamine methyltransferase [Oscillospiraceae bacterium]
MTYSSLCIGVRNTLRGRGISGAELEARLIVCAAAGIDADTYYRCLGQTVPDRTMNRCEELLGRRLSGEPVAYITGKWEFFGLELIVDRRVLIPRIDTEILAEEAIRLAAPGVRILDMCCGSGCVGIAAAVNLPGSRAVLADISREALSVAGENIALLGLEDKVSTALADSLGEYDPSLGKFDMIVCNPPYIRTDEAPRLDASVKDYEPGIALFGGADGLDHYRSICSNWTGALFPGGYILFECGAGQARSVEQIMRENGLKVKSTVKDTSGVERVAVGQK